MKKMIMSIALMLSIGLTQMNAQDLSFGLKADANVSNFILKDIPDGKSKMKPGASLGGFLKYDFNENFAIQPELLFHYKTSFNKTVNIDDKFKYWGVEIPVYAVGQWNTGNGRFYVGVGPYAGFGFKSKYSNSDLNLYKEKVMRRLNVGGGAMLGYEFGNGILLNAGYKIGFINALDKQKKEAKMRPQSISLGLGYRF
jgi:hypothetical protein